jgi:hypothetical protein
MFFFSLLRVRPERISQCRGAKKELEGSLRTPPSELLGARNPRFGENPAAGFSRDIAKVEPATYFFDRQEAPALRQRTSSTDRPSLPAPSMATASPGWTCPRVNSQESDFYLRATILGVAVIHHKTPASCGAAFTRPRTWLRLCDFQPRLRDSYSAAPSTCNRTAASG